MPTLPTKTNRGLLIALLLAGPATASEGEHVLSVSGEYVMASGHGGGATARYSYGLDDYWNLTVDVGWARLVAETDLGDSDRLGGSVGVLYHLDAFAWVPYLVFALEGNGILDPSSGRWGVGLELGGGLDYRPGRAWSVGAYALWHVTIWGDAPRFPSFGLRLNTYF